jgi:alginate O-acetyltransferase complex protein AlgI
MLFISPDFLELFLPAVFLCFYAVHYVRPSLGILVLLCASLIFCGVNGAWQSVLLWCSIAFNFGLGSLLLKVNGARKSRAILISGVTLDLLVLGYFKYAAFFISNVNSLFRTEFLEPQTALPIGISFYTFTQIAFLADVYAARGPNRLSPSSYALFVTYFPHVIAGPIIHWREMMPQFEQLGALNSELNSPEHRERICRGICLFGIGLAKKVLLADQLAPFVEKGYGAIDSIGFNDAWLLSFSYTFQLYFDFSGYSDMAIGMSLLFGVMLPFNFNAPYRATSIQEFWHRWHMTLSRWLRDYVFIPIGGSRGTVIITLRNLFVTFLLGGIWHGAAWTFVVWGALHGLACCVHRLWSFRSVRLPSWLAWAATFLFVNASWVFFRAPSLAAAVNVLSAMACPSRTTHVLSHDVWAVLALAAIIVWAAPTSQRIALETKFGLNPLAASFAGAFVVLAIVTQNSSAPSPFLYFNF